ncbi:glycosyltransferase family 2 protein [bacterium]|nr:glycosyltransferase family 2 protein [bacterium]
MEGEKYLSIVVPLFNEEGNVEELHRRIISACQKIGGGFEIIFVNDGSTDGTVKECKGLTPLKLIEFRKNFGQTAALDAGFKEAKGKIIITMDGDLQNDPADISVLLKEMKKGYDIVSGWRWQRKDSLSKRIFSRGADRLRKIFMQDNIHDSGCSLKAYKKECFHDLDLFGEMHRFIPALLEMQGYKVGEVKVSHYPRIKGVSKYNWKRAIKGLVDMMAVWFWRKYANRPLHLFGAAGIAFSFLGTAILIWMAVARIFFSQPLQGKIWPVIGIFLFLVGIQLFVSGLLADMAVKNYYKARNSTNYSIKKIVER